MSCKYALLVKYTLSGAHATFDILPPHFFSLTAHSSDHERLPEALSLTRETLSYVNGAVTECENARRLEDLQRRMDRKPIENSSNPLVANHKVRP